MEPRELQQRLEDLYEVRTALDVNAFLVTDPRLAAILDTSRNARDVPEKLLVQQGEDELSVSLFLDEDLLRRLAEDSPARRLHEGNLGAFWTALEGVSHFVYLAWNAQHDRPVSKFELELQAEVDKYAMAAALLAEQRGGRLPEALHAILFEDAGFDPALGPEERERYTRASDYAGRYCGALHRHLIRSASGKRATRELRRFYRLSRRHKLNRIRESLSRYDTPL